jgi:hypothetical protein
MLKIFYDMTMKIIINQQSYTFRITNGSFKHNSKEARSQINKNTKPI